MRPFEEQCKVGQEQMWTSTWDQTMLSSASDCGSISGPLALWSRGSLWPLDCPTACRSFDETDVSTVFRERRLTDDVQYQPSEYFLILSDSLLWHVCIKRLHNKITLIQLFLSKNPSNTI